MEEKKTMTVREFATYMGIGLNSAYNMVRSKGFPCIRLGKKYLVITDKVEDFINNNIGKTF